MQNPINPHSKQYLGAPYFPKALTFPLNFVAFIFYKENHYLLFVIPKEHISLIKWSVKRRDYYFVQVVKYTLYKEGHRSGTCLIRKQFVFRNVQVTGIIFLCPCTNHNVLV